jgi:hypothetical protein
MSSIGTPELGIHPAGRPAQARHFGRSFRSLISRVSVGYDRPNPSGCNSSNKVNTHRCGSSASRGADVGLERCERISGPGPNARLALPGQIGRDRLPIPPGMPGDRSDRPALAVQWVDVHVVLPCEHEEAGLQPLSPGFA